MNILVPQLSYLLKIWVRTWFRKCSSPNSRFVRFVTPETNVTGVEGCSGPNSWKSSRELGTKGGNFGIF